MTNSDTISQEQLFKANDNFLFLGLDIETTGSLQERAELIQIGLYVDDDHKYVSDVGHKGKFYWEPKAFEINKFTFERIWAGPPAFTVDKELEEFIFQLKRDFDCESKNIIPVGLNVGSFDMQFVRRTFPLFRSLLGYHTVDLNALMIYQMVNRTNFDLYKTGLKAKCTPLVKSKGEEHDALFDAELSIKMLNLHTELDLDIDE